jgi:hypothetical protein
VEVAAARGAAGRTRGRAGVALGLCRVWLPVTTSTPRPPCA